MVKILIVKLGAIGDVLRTTSLLPGLKEKYKSASIDWLTASNAREVLLNNPLIANLFTWEERGRLGAYDLVIGLEDDRTACEFIADLKPSRISGAYWNGEKQTYTPSVWFDMSLISQYGLERANELKKQNCQTYQQHMADLLGIKISPYVFNLTEEEIEYGGKVVRSKGIKKDDKVVGVNTGAGKRWPRKSWSVNQTIELIKRLKNELGVISLILGGEEEKERNHLIAKATGLPDAGGHSLRQFASIVAQTEVLLSSDSLALHFGIALHRRMVVLFGPTSVTEIELYGLGEKLAAPIDCAVCYKKECDIKPNCLDLLSVNEVFEAVRRQLTI